VCYLDGLIGGSVPIADSIVATTDDTYLGYENLTSSLQIEDWAVRGERLTMESAEALKRWNINADYRGQ
jgi:hypothetical protein